MAIALTLTIAAGLAMLALIAGGALLARRVATGEGSNLQFGEWRFYPSPWVLMLLPIAVALLFARFVPFLIFIPFVLPFILRRRGGFGGLFSRPRPRDDRDDDHASDRDRFRDL